MSSTAWQKTLAKADTEQDRLKQAARIAEEYEHQDVPNDQGEVASAIRYVGNVLLASLIAGVVLGAISMAIGAYQLRQVTGG